MTHCAGHMGIRVHESRRDLAPAAVHFGYADAIPADCPRIKRMTRANHRLRHQLRAA